MISIDLTSEESEALAQFLKRVGFSDFRKLSTSDEEAYTMQSGAEKIRRFLAKDGFSPR